MDNLLMNQKKNESNNIKYEKLVCITACLVIVAPSIISLFTGIIRSFIIPPFKLDTLFVYGIFTIIVLLSLKKILKRSINPIVYIATFMLLFMFLITFLLNSQYSEYFIALSVDLLIKSIPWFFVGFAVRDYEVFKKYIYISGIIILISYMINAFILKTDLFGGRSYTQAYTYMLLVSSIIFADAVYDNKKVYNILLLFASTIIMFSLGARGPLVCLIFYVLLKSFKNSNLKPKKAIINGISLLGFGILIYVFLYDILNKLLSLFHRMNQSTRTISRILEGSFFQDVARISLMEYSIDLIKEHPLMGVGVGKERILLAQHMGGSSFLAEAIGWYPHNVFLEILLHFGIFIGGAIIIYIIRIMYISVIKNTSKKASDIICIFIGIGLFPLLFSGSYITSPTFFMLIGLCLHQYIRFMDNKKLKYFTKQQDGKSRVNI